MFFLNERKTAIINSDFVERFCIDKKNDAVLIIASYSDVRAPVTIARYKDEKEAKDALAQLLIALQNGAQTFELPDSLLFYEQEIKKDARTKRKGGS